MLYKRGYFHYQMFQIEPPPPPPRENFRIFSRNRFIPYSLIPCMNNFVQYTAIKSNTSTIYLDYLKYITNTGACRGGRPGGQVPPPPPSSRMGENFILLRVSVRLSEGGNCKNFRASRRISGKKLEKALFFPGRAKKADFLNNQGGTLDIFALVPPPHFGHGTPLKYWF